MTSLFEHHLESTQGHVPNAARTAVLWCRSVRPAMSRLKALQDDWNFEAQFNAQATPGSERRKVLARCAEQLLAVIREAESEEVTG